MAHLADGRAYFGKVLVQVMIFLPLYVWLIYLAAAVAGFAKL